MTMMPISSWYFKLKNMSKPRNQLRTNSKIHTSPSPAPKNHPLSHLLTIQSRCRLQSNQTKSYCFTTNNSPTKTTRIPDKPLAKEPPRKSSRKLRRRRSICSRNVIRSPGYLRRRQPPSPRGHVSMSISAGCICRPVMKSIWTKTPQGRPPPDSDYETCSSENEYSSNFPEYRSDHMPGSTFDAMLPAACSSTSSTKCKANEQNKNNAVMIHTDDNRPGLSPSEVGSGSSSSLPPIITKKINQRNSTSRRNADASTAYESLSRTRSRKDELRHKVKRDTSSPERATCRRLLSTLNSKSGAGVGVKLKLRMMRNSSSGSCFAVVKSSRDPRGEFLESMVEMIVENDLRGSKDLEELLACYLSLNSQEYHHLIISVFKQIWFHLVIHPSPPLSTL